MDTHPFRFSDLPGEIRNKIYKLLLCDFEEPDDLATDSLVTVEETTKHKHNIDTAILRVSHQIHQEARDVLLKENQFVRVEAHFPILAPVIRAVFIAPRLPVITADEDAVKNFKGHVMTYSFEEEARVPKYHFCCLILHRYFDPVCRRVAKADVWMPVYESKTRHTLTLHDPYQRSSTTHQEHLVAPFRRHLRGLKHAFIQGKVDKSLAKAVLSEVKQNPLEDPDAIIRELKEAKSVGAEYFKKGDTKMSAESWAKACIRIQNLQSGPSWGVLSANQPFVDDLNSLLFAFNLNIAQNSLKVMEQTPDDMERVEGIAYSALLAIRNAFDELPQGGGWQPTPAQMAKLWFRKAKVHRLCKDYHDAWQAICFADHALPGDPLILQEKGRIYSSMI